MKSSNNEPVKPSIYELSGKNGIKAKVTNYGASLISLWVPDKHGKLADVILGYDDISSYQKGKVFHGGTIGRFANRISDSQFKINKNEYIVTKNDGKNCLHGGSGFHTKVFSLEEITENKISLSYISPDNEDGFPSDVQILVTYELSENSLKISTLATNIGTLSTPVSLTNHSYFNLSSENISVLDHSLHICSSEYTPIDSDGLPIGEIASVAGTRFDFQNPRKINEHFDDNFILKRKYDGILSEVLTLVENKNGRMLKLSTTLPALQLYTGSYLDEIGKNKTAYNAFSGLCLEPQFTPDTPNLLNKTDIFPSCILAPSECRSDVIVYEFLSH